MAEEIIKQLRQIYMLEDIYYEKPEYYTSHIPLENPEGWFTHRIYLEYTTESSTGIAKIVCDEASILTRTDADVRHTQKGSSTNACEDTVINRAR